MKVKVHLISMPWTSVEYPSIQTGSLKSYLDYAFKKTVVTMQYPAFMMIPYFVKNSNYREIYYKYFPQQEYLYYLIFKRRFLRNGTKGALKSDIYLKKNGKENRISKNLLNRLERSSIQYIEDHLVPNLLRNGVNLIGFSLTYAQIFSSLFCLKYLLKKYPEGEYLFLFGGYNAWVPSFYELLGVLDVDAGCVLGNGEKPLEETVSRLLKAKSYEKRDFLRLIGDEIDEVVYPNNGSFSKCDSKGKELIGCQNQDSEMAELPVPIYDEYFKNLRDICSSEEVYNDLKSLSMIQVEGSRGCFGKCDFCGVNIYTKRFRSKTPGKIYDELSYLAEKYRITTFLFTDNSCDAWIKKCLLRMLDENIHVSFNVSLQAAHEETFWTLLLLAGVKNVTIGIESLSDDLLRSINKAASAMDNVKTQKHLTELKIENIISNLIFNHPASTSKDVAITRQILKKIPHLIPFTWSSFSLSYASSLYNRLVENDSSYAKNLYRINDEKDIVDQYLIKKNRMRNPEVYRTGKRIASEWKSLEKWYCNNIALNEDRDHTMSVRKLGRNTMLIDDKRYGNAKQHILRGEDAIIYDLCHAGCSAKDLREKSGIQELYIRKALKRLMEKDLLLKIKDQYLSLALRERYELVNNFYKSVPALD